MGVSMITRQIKNFVLTEAGMDKVGIASIDRFNQSPKGMHPTDYLPGCKSVISFCIRVPDGAVNAIYRTFEDKIYDVHGIYGAYGYVGGPNYHLLRGNYKISQYVERLTGCTAAPQTAGPTHGAKMLSMRHMAFAAGLGEFGWHSIMMTPEFGPRNRFGAVLTTAELEPDPLYNGPKLCDPSKCRVCEKMCPSGAIPPYNAEQARTICTGGKEISYSGINWNKCKLMCHGVYQEYNDSGSDLVPREITDPLTDDLDPMNAYFRKHPMNNFPQHVPTWKCGNCLAYCPVGNWKQRFYDTGLSSVDTSQFIEDTEWLRRIDEYTGRATAIHSDAPEEEEKKDKDLTERGA